MVFSDLSGSTALGERLDPESLSQVMARYYEVMRAVVQHHGGTVEKFAGDAVMAVFGIPAAHEDDALRAVRAASGMHQALGELNEELWSEWRVRLELHTGVNTGEVVAGDPGLGSSLVVGDAVNLAARLEQAAGPGQILLGRGTWSLVRDAVEVEPPRVLALQGRQAGEPAYRLLTVRPGAAGRTRRLDAPFVGRASELQLFHWAYERAAGEAALHLLTVLGGAGVGKTRLVLEAAGRLSDQPAVLLGRCLPYGNGSTFWPLAEVVRQAAGIGLEDPPAAARAKLAALLDRAPDGALVAERIGQLIGLEADPAPIEEAVWSTRRLLEAMAADHPLVAVFDDLHWAEPTFLDLLEQLAESTAATPILLVAVARPELLEQRPAWAGGRSNAVSVLLEPLGPDESGALLEGLAGGGTLPARARERITRAAGGNPLFIEELLATLVEEGRLRRQGSAWVEAGDLAASGTPPTIQALVAARLDRLDGRDRDVLERAAVVGQAFEQDTVAELSPPAARAEVPERLRGLVRREFLRPAPARLPAEAGYQFRHLLVRDAVYQAVPKQVRVELHERLAGLLEARAGARVREYEEIVGYHLEQAWRCLAELGPIDRRGRELGARAAGRLAAAGRRALARGDTPAATTLLDRALALLQGDDPFRGHLLNDLAESLVAAGDFGRAAEVLTAATVAAEAGADGSSLLAQVAVGRLGMRLLTEPGLPLDAIQGEVDRAIAALDQAGDDRGLARAWRLLGYESFMRCRIERAEAALARTIEHARRAGDERVDAYARGMLAAAAFWGPLPVSSGLDRCRRLLDDAAGNRYVEGSVLHVLGALAAMQGRFEQARDLVDQGAEVAATLGRLRLAAIWSQFAATVESLAGRPEAAEERLHRGYRTLERMGETGARSNLAADLAHTLVVGGRHDEARRFADLSRALAAREDVYAQVRWRAATARTLAAGGDAGQAARLAREAVELAETTDMLNLRADALLDLAETAELCGRPEEAAAAAARCLPLYERKGNQVAAAAVRARLGLAAPRQAGGRSAG